MKQVAQRMRDGQMRVLDVPSPELSETDVLVRSMASLVSAGTERAKVTVAREGLIGKARRRPDQLRQVIDKARSDGLSETIAAVRSRLDALAPLGYCIAGRVERVGPLVRDIVVGDLVACGGDASAHAEILAVPSNVAVRVPDGVRPQAAAFTTLGAIALHGFRQADSRIGDRVAVVGMGLVGQLTARIAHAAGCEVLGIDFDPWKLELARAAGSIDLARVRTEVRSDVFGGFDAVLVTAAAPSSSDPVSIASQLARDRGRIVIVGDVRLDLDRRHLYEHELELRLARSYGPGRYDREYEERGLDYPIGYVRWTERRNMAAFLAMLERNEVTVDDLITHTFPVDRAIEAFDLLADTSRRSLALVIEYPRESESPVPERRKVDQTQRRAFNPGFAVGFVGAGSFAQRHLIPLARQHGLTLDLVATSSGLSAASAAEQFEFARGACTPDELITDERLNAVVVATRHDRHAALAIAALRAGKAVLVEKPLCLNETELEEIAAEAARDDAPPLMVGFNRRHAPQVAALREALPPGSPAHALIRVNAGALPAEHWLNDPREGGGRLLGEGCHFFDLLTFLVGSKPVAVSTQARHRHNEPLQSAQDFVASVRFADGSLGTVVYMTGGSGKLGKELIEVHRAGRSGRIDDFADLTLWVDGRPRSTRSRSRDKGHSAEMALFASVTRGEAEVPGLASYIDSMRLTIGALRSLESGKEHALRDSAESSGA